MGEQWEEIDRDSKSGRRIFKREVNFGDGGYGGQYFELRADFEVRDAEGRVLLKTDGTAKGDYWCGTFLWFVQDTGGQRVRLYQSDTVSDVFFDVPEAPVTQQGRN